MAGEFPKRDGSPDDRTQLLQWFFAARRQIVIGRRDRAHELLTECLAMEPDNLLVARLFVDNWRAMADASGDQVRPRRSWFRVRSLRRAAGNLLKRPRDLGSLDALAGALHEAAPPEVLAETLPIICDTIPPTERAWRFLAEAFTSLGRCDEALARWQVIMAEHNLTAEDRFIVTALESIAATPRESSEDPNEDVEFELTWLSRRATVARDAAEASQYGVLQRLASQLEVLHRDAGIDIYRRLVERHPDRGALRRRLVEFLLQTGDLTAAQTAIESAADDATDPWLQATLAQIYQRRRRFAEALGLYRAALERAKTDAPWRARTLRQAAQLAEVLGETELAAKWRSEAVDTAGEPD